MNEPELPLFEVVTVPVVSCHEYALVVANEMTSDGDAALVNNFTVPPNFGAIESVTLESFDALPATLSLIVNQVMVSVPFCVTHPVSALPGSKKAGTLRVPDTEPVTLSESSSSGTDVSGHRGHYS